MFSFKTKPYLQFLLGFVVLVLSSCLKDKTVAPQFSQIQLNWNKSYEDDSLHKAVIGMEWIMSYIGADHTERIYSMPQNDQGLLLDVSNLGFSQSNVEKLEFLNQKIIETEEYDLTKGVDFGRYANLLLGASAHYYSFVEMPNNYDDLLSQYTLGPDSGFVDNSLITNRHRRITYSSLDGFNQLWVMEELDENTGELIEYETMDFMGNGQPRFGIYDVNGILKDGSDPNETEAGKPAKCMWCHESLVQPLFTSQNDFTDYLSFLELTDTLSFYRQAIETQQSNVLTGVDYTKKQDHAFAELLYVTFSEPSLERLSVEWSIAESSLETILENVPTHTNLEYPYLGELYFRKDVKQFSPFIGLSISTSAREQSQMEVNHLE